MGLVDGPVGVVVGQIPDLGLDVVEESAHGFAGGEGPFQFGEGLVEGVGQVAQFAGAFGGDAGAEIQTPRDVAHVVGEAGHGTDG